MPSIRISENLYIVGGMFISHSSDCNVYLVKGDSPVLIDCGSGERHEVVRRNIEELGVALEDIEWVLGTHGHYDHLNGIERLRADRPGLKLAMHAADAPAIESADPERTCAGWFFGVDIEPQQVDMRLAGGETFDAGGTMFEVLHTPGHTPGSISLRAEIDGRTVLFSGDCLVPGNDRVGSDYDDWQETIDRLRETEFSALMPGHTTQFLGDPFTVALAAKTLSAPVGEAIIRFLKDGFSRPLWWSSTFQYSYTMPILARLSSKKRI